jgi:hypothetical protein
MSAKTTNNLGKKTARLPMRTRQFMGAAILAGCLALGAAAGAQAEPHNPYKTGERHDELGAARDSGFGDAPRMSAFQSGDGNYVYGSEGNGAFGYYVGQPGQPATRPGYAGAAFFNGWAEEDHFDNGPVRAKGCYSRCLSNHSERYCQKHWLTHCQPEGPVKKRRHED